MKFKSFGKISRLSREIIITEKIDGTNAQVFIYNKAEEVIFPDTPHEELITDDFILKHCLAVMDGCLIFAGSRTRWLDCSSNGDNYGFAKWVKANAEELIKLGEGRHFGEWYGYGIQRGYGLEEKRFALFNVGKWASRNVLINNILCERNELTEDDKRTLVPKCCKVVPILYEGTFDTNVIDDVLDGLRQDGSIAVPGYMKPEGLVVYHKTSGQLFKKTIENDEKPKSIK